MEPIGFWELWTGNGRPTVMKGGKFPKHCAGGMGGGSYEAARIIARIYFLFLK